MKNILLTLFIAIIIISCNPQVDKYDLIFFNKFQLKELIANKTKLRMDGYYYSKTDSNHIPEVCIFYNDGTYFDFLGSEFLDHIAVSNSKFKIKNNIKECVWCWGVFLIKNDTIKIQKFSPGRVGFNRDIDEILVKIQNDSTIHFFKFIMYSKTIFGMQSDEIELNYTMYFKHLDFKPDSMNFMMDDFKSEDK